MRPTTTRTIALAASAGLALAACSGDPVPDEEAAPEETPTASSPETAPTSPADTMPGDGGTDGSPTPADDPTPTPADEATPILASIDTPELDSQCVLEPQLEQVDTIRYAVPAAWRVEDRCDILDPDLEELPQQTEVDAAIFVGVADVAFSRTRGPSPTRRDTTTWLGSRAGFQAVRETYVGTGAAMSEDGDPGTSWSYDLDAGTDEQGGVLTLRTGDVEPTDDQFVQATLDTIAQTVVIEPAAQATGSGPGQVEFTVLRVEGGGTPYAVTYDGDCFAYRPGGPTDEVADEVCDLDPTAGHVVAAQLGDTVVGYAPPTTIAVQSDEIRPPYGLATSIEGGTVFAVPAADLPPTLTAVGPGGEELVTADVG